MSAAAPRPAVFLDRDGTVIVEVDYLADPERVELVPGSGPALRRLMEAGYALVLVTNQSGIARGRLDEDILAAIHARLDELLAPHGVRFDGVYYCPHHPEHGGERYAKDCDCRKPRPGMLLQAARELDLDLGRSCMVGDAARDLEAGWAVGARGFLVRTGKGARQIEAATERAPGPGWLQVVDDLPAAAAQLLSADPADPPQGR